MTNKISGIYCIENLINGKRYIGLTNDIARRKREHFWLLNKGAHENRYLQNAWNKYGENNFIFYIVEKCPISLLDCREIHYIYQYQSSIDKLGYNIESGGRSNQKVSQETRKKMSDALKGRSFSDEHKERIGKALKGREFSDETREKMRQAKVGKMDGKKHPGRKPVYCPELNQEFWGAKEAEELYGIDRTYIYACISGRQKSAGKHPETGEKLHWISVDALQTIQN